MGRQKNTPFENNRAPSVSSLRQQQFFRDQKAINRLSGVNPVSFKADDADRFELFEQLRRFYARYDAVRITTGIGQIVDWAMVNGMDRLNQRLLIKYGENIESMLKYEEEEEAMLQRGRTFTQETYESSDGRLNSYEESYNSSVGIAQPLRVRLTTFYKENDPKQLKDGIDDIIAFVKTHGLDALNQELEIKYGKHLDIADERPTSMIYREYGSKKEKKANGRKTKAEKKKKKANKKQEKEKEKGKKKAEKEKEKEKVKGKTDKPDQSSGSEKKPQKKRLQISDNIKNTIDMYYSVYDPYSLTGGSIKHVYRWTAENGIEALSKQVKVKYGESLRSFVERLNLLQDDLIRFYTKHDENRLVQGLNQIVRWGLRNGRDALNAGLRDKYGNDLDWERQEDESFSAMFDVTPEF